MAAGGHRAYLDAFAVLEEDIGRSSGGSLALEPRPVREIERLHLLTPKEEVSSDTHMPNLRASSEGGRGVHRAERALGGRGGAGLTTCAPP